MFAIIIIPVRLSAKVSNQELRNRDGLPVWLLGALFLMGASSYPRHTGLDHQRLLPSANFF
jgi:hypothetical protein